MRLDKGALVYAVMIEIVLAGLAAFGGPHGSLGAVPWTLQLPGILVLLFMPGQQAFVLRAVVAISIQIVVWYTVVALIRRGQRAKSR